MWKKSTLMETIMNLDKEWDEMKIHKMFENHLIGDFINIIITLIWLICVWVIFLVIQFIEAPIRMIMFKGKLIDKGIYWINCWRSAFNGMRGSEHG